MTKKDVLQMATLLMAIKKKYSMINLDPGSDLLVFNNEDRDELDFFPSKTLPQQMEELGLIQGHKQVLDPYTHYEADPKTGGWTAITNPPATYYNYRITAKGNEFLRNAPKTLGHPLPPLKLASDSSVLDHMRVKPIKVVTYTRADLQKLRDDFIQISKGKIESLFAYPVGQETTALPDGIVCGPKLWSRLENEATRNGIRKGELRIKGYYSTDGGPEHAVEGVRPDSGISSQEQVRLFMKTLFQVFPFDGKLSIRELTEAESRRNSDFMDTIMAAVPSLTPMTTRVSFFVEYGNTRFLVKVANEARYDFLKISPRISLVELVERP